MKQRLLFIGIVGHAMRGLALAAKQLGYDVSGLDEGAEEGAGTRWLEEHGISWTHTPHRRLLEGVDLIIISGGTPADYPLLVTAREQGIAIQSYAEFLGHVTKGETSLVVAGTHGKTTTTALITWLLEAAGQHPDYLIGIKPFNFDSSARLDHAKVVVLEGDEYKSSNLDTRAKFLYYHPDILVLTAIEHDHPDVYPDLQSVVDTFVAGVKKLPRTGRLIACAESPTVLKVAKHSAASVVSYGLGGGDYLARDIAYLPTGIEFDVAKDDAVLGRVAVPLYGKHNVLNTLAAVVVALEHGLSMQQIIQGAATFKGAYRRFNLVSNPDANVTVVDDYAHHPTEAATNIEAARLHFPGRRVVVVYRPHTFSRTKALLGEYQRAFDEADLVYITDIEAAREAGQGHPVSGNDIVQGMEKPAVYTPTRDTLMHQVLKDAKPGDVLLCFSVSGYGNLAQELAYRLA